MNLFQKLNLALEPCGFAPLKNKTATPELYLRAGDKPMMAARLHRCVQALDSVDI